MSDYAALYMEAFVAIVDKLAKAKGFKKGEFATTVWPEVSHSVAVNRWQYMRTKSHITGQPQVVTLPDALKMTEVLDVDLPYILLQTRAAADEKFAAQNEEPQKTKASSQEFKELERMRSKAGHDKAQALLHAKQEGHQEGEQRKALNVARKLLGMGLPTDQIMTATDLSREEIENLRH